MEVFKDSYAVRLGKGIVSVDQRVESNAEDIFEYADDFFFNKEYAEKLQEIVGGKLVKLSLLEE